MYNQGGFLYWNGNELGTTGSAGGWTDGGSNVYTTTDGDNVGIGTNSPNKLGNPVCLTIAADDSYTSTSTAGLELVGRQNSANSPVGQISFFGSTTGNHEMARIETRTTPGYTNHGQLAFYTQNGSSLNQVMLIDDAGDVGIGITTPNSKLEVAGMIHSTLGGFKFPDGSLLSSKPDTSHWQSTGSNLYYKDAGTVGIGDSSPTYKLDVAGKIGINDYQVLYLPEQHMDHFLGTLIVGSGGADLAHSVDQEGQYNTGVGTRALWSITSGWANTACGGGTLYELTSGDYNTACGFSSLYQTSTGEENTAVGYYALYTNTTGYGNTAIGKNADISTNNLHNATAIGYYAEATASNQVRLGNDNIDTFYCMGAYEGVVGGTHLDLYVDNTGKIGHLSSSVRYKENISDMSNVDWLFDLRPVNFTYKADENHKVSYGLIAEEVEEINPEFVSYDSEGRPETVTYSELISPLLKAVQEQQKQIEVLQAEIERLKER